MSKSQAERSAACSSSMKNWLWSMGRVNVSAGIRGGSLPFCRGATAGRSRSSPHRGGTWRTDDPAALPVAQGRRPLGPKEQRPGDEQTPPVRAMSTHRLTSARGRRSVGVLVRRACEVGGAQAEPRLAERWPGGAGVQGGEPEQHTAHGAAKRRVDRVPEVEAHLPGASGRGCAGSPGRDGGWSSMLGIRPTPWQSGPPRSTKTPNSRCSTTTPSTICPARYRARSDWQLSSGTASAMGWVAPAVSRPPVSAPGTAPRPSAGSLPGTPPRRAAR